jgi:hypothetical protein
MTKEGMINHLENEIRKGMNSTDNKVIGKVAAYKSVGYQLFKGTRGYFRAKAIETLEKAKAKLATESNFDAKEQLEGIIEACGEMINLSRAWEAVS